MELGTQRRGGQPGRVYAFRPYIAAPYNDAR